MGSIRQKTCKTSGLEILPLLQPQPEALPPILILFYYFVKINKFSANTLGLDLATLRKPRGQKSNT